MKSVCTRRQFLSSILATSVAPSLYAKTQTLSAVSDYFISAQGSNKNSYSIASYNALSRKQRSIPSNFRGHGIAQNPVKSESLIMFARRPGKYGIEVDISTGEISQQFEIADNNSMMGHGFFSADGNHLFTSEADNKTGEGKIVVRDTEHYNVVDEMQSYGIGPHEIKLMPDNKTIVAANGGILTRAETGRKKLNLDNMHSSLSYIDMQTGEQKDIVELKEKKASIRHIDVANDGSVIFATQVQREALSHNNVIPLAGVHKSGKPYKSLSQPSIIIEKMKDYMGSVVFNNTSRIAGFTSPRGNLATFWHIDSNKFMGYHQFNDVCGIAVSSDDKQFILSNSSGQLRQLDASTLVENKVQRVRLPNTQWDNHMITVTL